MGVRGNQRISQPSLLPSLNPLYWPRIWECYHYHRFGSHKSKTLLSNQDYRALSVIGGLSGLGLEMRVSGRLVQLRCVKRYRWLLDPGHAPALTGSARGISSNLSPLDFLLTSESEEKNKESESDKQALHAMQVPLSVLPRDCWPRWRRVGRPPLDHHCFLMARTSSSCFSKYSHQNVCLLEECQRSPWFFHCVLAVTIQAPSVSAVSAPDCELACPLFCTTLYPLYHCLAMYPNLQKAQSSA